MSFQTTIPREILKWIQSLDLSYSVRDTKRDLMNGFLIAEIFSRKYPGMIYMHSMDNSSKKEKIQSNWQLLYKFFHKNELPFSKSECEKMSNDPDFPSLVDFITKIYSFLTQKKMTKAPLAGYLATNKDFYSTVSAGDRNLGTSFILKDKGLEKLEDKKTFGEGGNISSLQEKEKENTKIVNDSTFSEKGNSPVKKTNFLRNFNKPISQNPDAGNLTIDVKNISIRPVNLNFSRLKEQQAPIEKNLTPPPLGGKSNERKSSFKNKLQLMNHEDLLKAASGVTDSMKSGLTQKKDKPSEKTIFDALNEIISIRFTMKNFADELKKIKVNNSQILQSFCDNIESFSDEFSCTFFEELLGQTDGLIKFVFKDQNELWKYLHFLFTCLKGLTTEGKAFKTLVETIKIFGEKCLEYNPQNSFRTRSMFQQYYLPSLCSQIKTAPRFERKELLLKILYSFSPPDPKSRFETLLSFKALLKSPSIYLQSLTVLTSQGLSLSDQPLFEEVLKASKTFLQSPSPSLRTMSLALLNKLIEGDPERVSPLVEKNINNFANSEWWESKALTIELFSKGIRSIVESEKYQSLLKQNMSTHKSFSLENEQMIGRFHEKIGLLAKGISTAALPPVNENIVRLSFIQIAGILAEHKSLMELFIHLFLLSNEDTRKWVFYSKEPENELYREEFLIESDRSLRYRVNIRSSEFEKHSSNILIYIVEMIKELKNDKNLNFDRLTPEYMDLLVYGFTFTDFKMINMELCENINNAVKEFIFIALCDDELCEKASVVASTMLRLQFYSEVKIKDADKLLASAICLIYQNSFEPCKSNIEDFLRKFSKDAFDNAVDIIKRFLLEVYLAIKAKTGETYLKNTSLGEVFSPVSLLVDKEEEDVRKVALEKKSSEVLERSLTSPKTLEKEEERGEELEEGEEEGDIGYDEEEEIEEEEA